MAQSKVNILVSVAKMLFGEQLWRINVESLSGAKRRLVKFIKLTRITFSQFMENRMGFQCVALSYYVALSIIPFFALVFVVTDGLHLTGKLSNLLFEFIPADPQFLTSIMEKAEGILDIAKSGGVGIIGGCALLWTILRLMFQVENVFNNVWGIKKIPRKLYKRFGFYIGATILSPFIIILFSAGIVIYSDITSLINFEIPIEEFSKLSTFAGWAVFAVLATLVFSVMYKFIPASDIKYRNAFWAAMITAVVFSVFQFLYLKTQVFVTRTNAVYGVIAAIPLFMMWLDYSWQIILYGAHLCFGMENVDTYHIPDGPLREYTPNMDRIKKDMELNEIVKEDK